MLVNYLPVQNESMVEKDFNNFNSEAKIHVAIKYTLTTVLRKTFITNPK